MRIIVIFMFFFFCQINLVYAVEQIDLAVKKNSNSLEVNVKILPSKEFIDDFTSGMSKDIHILIELYRKWSVIPDEFIIGKKFQRIFISDPIKEEYIIKSFEGNTWNEKRFKKPMDALLWGLNIESVIFDDIKNYNPGKYYFRVTVESNIKKLPFILEHLFFFIPTYEIRKEKETEKFYLP